jgi:tight adherence protein B
MDVIGYFFLIASVLVGIVLLFDRAAKDRSAREAKRIKQAGDRKPKHTSAKIGAVTSIDRQQETRGEALFKNLGTDPQAFRRKLKAADLNITIVEFVLLQFIIFAGIVACIAFGTRLPLWAGVLIGGIVGFYGPRLWVKKRTDKRTERFNKIFPDALELMVRSLRTGLPIAECVKSVARDAPNPVGEEFARMRDDIKLGSTVSEAVWKTSERLQTQEFNFFAIALSVQSETGGNLAESLDNLADILRKRQQIYRMIKAKAAEAVWTGRVLGGLPFFMFGMISAMAPDYAAILYTDKRGMILATVGLVWIGFGIIWMRSMIRFDF